MSTQKTWPLSFSIGYKNPPKKSMWPFDLEFQSWTKGILMSSQTVHLAHFSTFSLSWNRGFLCPLIAWQSTTNLSFHSGRNKAKKSHFNTKWFQFEFTCPKFFLRIFVHKKNFFDKFLATFLLTFQTTVSIQWSSRTLKVYFEGLNYDAEGEVGKIQNMHRLWIW